MRTLAFALVASALGSGVARAQAGEIAGTVSALGTSEPLAGAQITVVSQAPRATSDERGRFRLAGVSGSVVTLEVRRIGYAVARVGARVGQTDLRITLSVNPVSLEQVVVTGTPGAAQKRELGNAVTTINAADVTAKAPIQSMQQLLNGRAPGVVIMPASGAVGSGSQVRVRGLSSFSLGNNPLLYVDGVRINNAAATGPENQSFGSSSISRLNDINPQDIESIEILKGPSAATLYGTEASNGVINIITKKGTTGAARWSATVRQGVNYLQNWKSRFPTNYGIVNGNVIAVSMDSLIKYNGGDIFRTGHYQENELAVNGGTSLFTYYASGNLLDSQGAEPTNATRKYNGRLNLGVSPSDKIRISANVGLVHGPTDLSAEAGYGGRVWTTLLATPTTYSDPYKHGFYSGVPADYDKVYAFWQDLDRLTTSLRVEHQPVAWFQHRATFGWDRTAESNNTLWRRNNQLDTIPTFDPDAQGLREVNDVTTSYQTFDYAATATFDWRSAFRFATSGGAQYYRDGSGNVYAYGEVFPVPGLTSVQATTTNKLNSQDFVENATLGFYGQEQVGWRDRLFATVAVRSDQNSAFGTNFKRIAYPKYSLSWVLSEEPWFRGLPYVQALNSFRVRAAYGQAGKQPATYAAQRTYAPVSGPGDVAAVSPQFIGNPDLGPEVGKEMELGFDVGALEDRIGLEFTYYNKKTTNAILERQIAPSVGFSGTQPFNAGAVRNRGIEASLRATPYRSSLLTWDLAFNYATNDNKVLNLGGDQFVVAGTYVRHAVGYPAFGWWAPRAVSAQLDNAGNAIKTSVMCDDGKGGTTPCYNASGSFVGPVVYLGRSVPPHEGSFNTTLSFLDRFRVYTLIDFKNGQKKMDGNTRVRCTFFGGRCRENFFPTESDPVRVAEVQSNRNLVDFLITDASFAKWRELSFAYTVPTSLVRRIGVSRADLSVSGRNLHTWTSYQGFEPEAMFLGGSRGGNTAWEQTTLPQLTSWIFSVNLGF